MEQSNGKLTQYLQNRVRVITNHSKTFIGTFKSYDEEMNLILDECEEYRHHDGPSTAETFSQKRFLGFILVRGEHIVRLDVDTPPPSPRVNLPVKSNLNKGVPIRIAGVGAPYVAVVAPIIPPAPPTPGGLPRVPFSARGVGPRPNRAIGHRVPFVETSVAPLIPSSQGTMRIMDSSEALNPPLEYVIRPIRALSRAGNRPP